MLGLHRPPRSPLGHWRGSGNPGGHRRGAVPRALHPEGIAREYGRALVGIVGRAREAFADLLAELPALLAGGARARRDAPTPAPTRVEPPTWGNVSRKVYTLDPADLRARGVYSLPAGAQRGRVERIRAGRTAGHTFAPVRLMVHGDGSFEVIDGRHRLIEALEAGRPVEVVVERGSKAATAGSTGTTSIFEQLPPATARAAALPEVASVVGTGAETRRVRELIEVARVRLAQAIPTRDLEALAERFARQTATFQRIQFVRQTRAVLGADVFLADRRLEPLVAAFVDANVGLIRAIPEKLATDIEGEVMRAIQGGKLHADLAKDLARRFEFGEDRARLIARDQVGKAYAQIAQSRQRELGVTRFVWRTVEDERVRPEHETLNGKTFDYDEPPDEGFPGDAINCRCSAEPVLSDLLDTLGD